MNHDKFPYSPNRDRLTDLPDHAAISDHLDKLTLKMPGDFGLLAIDVDGFKGLNDERGHGTGDRLLIVIGQTLNDNLRRDDRFMPARRSGDEFLIALHGVHEDADIEAVAERIRILLTEQIQFIDNRVGISIGGRVHRIGETAEELMRAADELMAQDKDRRKIERYNSERAHEAIRKMAHLAFQAGIDDRDIPRLLNLHRRGLF
ncbi:MAG TPA: GGDEF domain-containing protein [Candidatus Saccharimonadales bacterium]|nr:GGDEF domain-containing protein [Candidatus Saccharimonadales bacterium]